MPLPVDYDSPAGEAAAELAIRQALGECFLVVGTAFGFTSDLVHERPRYPRTEAVWEAVGTIEDPETTGNDAPARLVRYCSFKFLGVRSPNAQEIILRYQFILSFGFKDEYVADPTKNSSNDLVGCAMQFRKYLAQNLDLGLGDPVTHRYLEIFDNDMIPATKQGDAAGVLYGRIEVSLQVCQF